MVKTLRRKSAEAVMHFGEARQFKAKGAKWTSGNSGDELARTCEGVLEVSKWLDAPEEVQRAGGKRVEAAEAMDGDATNAAANGC